MLLAVSFRTLSFVFDLEFALSHAMGGGRSELASSIHVCPSMAMWIHPYNLLLGQRGWTGTKLSVFPNFRHRRVLSSLEPLWTRVPSSVHICFRVARVVVHTGSE